MQEVAANKPREKAGAHTMARYGFQVHASILKILEVHRTGADYRAVFDHFDDLMMLDRSEQPEKVGFFQIKSQDKGEWTLAALTAKKGKSKPATFLGRLYHHMDAFGVMVSCLGFVSNLGFKLKLIDGTETTADNLVIPSSQLHPDVMAVLRGAVAKDGVGNTAVDGSQLFVFERIGLGLIEQDKFVKGALVEFIHEREDAHYIPVISLYETLRGSVFTKSGVTEEFTTEAEFYDRKTLSRADVETMFLRATSGRRFLDNWGTIAGDLTANGMRSRRMIVLKNSCILYIKARSVGEPGATAFNAAARDIIIAHQTEIDSYETLPEIVAQLEKWLPSDYEHREGALYVESFEAIG